jgi:hypothetical protein
MYRRRRFRRAYDRARTRMILILETPANNTGKAQKNGASNI